MRRFSLIVASAIVVAVLAQEPAAPKPEVPAEPRRPVYTFQGKPMKLDFACKEEDITAFGLTCSVEEPCEIFLEIAAVETVGNRLFLTGNLHTSAATLWSILLTSEDSGKTWTEGYERMRSTGLEHVQFIDFEAGWIGGQQLLSLPRDPFFLITGDGGKSWRKRAVYSETRVGAIEQFVFESRKIGSLLIDRTQSGDSGGRHEFYETQTGGESWTLRQVSGTPIKLKRTRTVNEDWRVRADAASKSYRLEHRVNQRWQVVSSFLIQVGECKPEELKLVEPPVETEAKKEEAAGTFVVEGTGGKKPAGKKKKP